ncbi:cell wall hydrolase/autolysin [Thermaerobacter marianensis DSM 12885]|uniref:Cell wall hydrolase/autolysin n=1 Tax=Thermaerobacter marianensis (strain ATCC 700841 / DSM 12885 / JCM 10246 / 7p75a) TaxID=644966 RepID=E6SMA0_THEM7|nr:N-acetylmuramoyl-L-alanine amidase [Thermaerobacter marianensis]ADU51459.1 cell wall hydrolase/autolysin [Thermaerobacter marianensis DSM 12885]
MNRGDAGKDVGTPPSAAVREGGAFGRWLSWRNQPAWGTFLRRGAWEAGRPARGSGASRGPAPAKGHGGGPDRGRWGPAGPGWAPWLLLGALALLALGRVAGVAASPEQGPLAGTLIVVDPGHGGVDRGACHLPSNTIESEIALDFSFLLRKLLRDQGARVLLTRTTDEDLDLDPRIEIANANGADYFLSIHVNWFPDPTCFGAQTFYFPGREESRRLALLVQDELKKVDPDNYREIQTGRYRVLRLTRMPGVLVELGFVDSPHDRAILHDAGKRRQLAEAIVRGVIRHRRGEAGPEPAPDLRDR